MKTFAYSFGSYRDAPHEYFVLLHSAEVPDTVTWNEYVDALARRIADGTKTIHVFAITDGGGPGPAQRRSLAAAFALDRRGSITHVFTTNPVTRGIVTAFQWLARSRVAAHPPDSFRTICDHLRIPTSAVLEDLRTLQKALPPVTLLEQIEQTSLKHR
jgi:hypothetical protein